MNWAEYGNNEYRNNSNLNSGRQCAEPKIIRVGVGCVGCRRLLPRGWGGPASRRMLHPGLRTTRPASGSDFYVFYDPCVEPFHGETRQCLVLSAFRMPALACLAIQRNSSPITDANTFGPSVIVKGIFAGKWLPKKLLHPKASSQCGPVKPFIHSRCCLWHWQCPMP